MKAREKKERDLNGEQVRKTRRVTRSLFVCPLFSRASPLFRLYCCPSYDHVFSGVQCYHVFTPLIF
ncbi:expressed protein [Arabidopsis lyrata subsp. lyrata]|uniref:Expressed protein n=1 Tax=Arabidopsis lyrata subsp. lyrata TaxID=81972 RepID=D7LJ86_ARALL|nr:expressed protein [Arabidopsis lyrata subsp. lyrata]